MEEAIRIAKDSKLEGLNLNYRLVDAALMSKMDEANLDVYVYTVNDPRAATSLAELGVKGITTDRPQWLKNQIKNL